MGIEYSSLFREEGNMLTRFLYSCQAIGTEIAALSIVGMISSVFAESAGYARIGELYIVFLRIGGIGTGLYFLSWRMIRSCGAHQVEGG